MFTTIAMSPRKRVTTPPERITLALSQVAAQLGREVRQERTRRAWTLATLAQKTYLSPSVLFGIESGTPASLDAYVRISLAFGWEPQFLLETPRIPGALRDADPVHAAMGEIEAAHFRGLGYEVRLDEPYQHYQFAGRADAAIIDRERRALLHLENRTRFPDTQAFLGSWNAKRAYLADDLAKRLQIRGGWQSIDHVVVALWTSEVLHSLRLRTETFRSACPDTPDSFAAWWVGSPPAPGTRTSLVVFDPLPGRRSSRRRWIGLDDVRSAEPRYRGYVHALEALKAGGLA